MSALLKVVSTEKEKSTNTRHWVQFLFFVLTLAIGLQFYLYVKQVEGSLPITIPRPAGVEGFLPIGALMAWKQFLMTGSWDSIHPAAMIIFGFAMVISFFLHKAFCSWFCPIGTLSEWLWQIGKRLFNRNFPLPFWLDLFLRTLKYVLLGFFLWIIISMPIQEIFAFIHSPYYKISDVKMLRFFTHMTVTTGIVVSILVFGSLFVKNFWCRYFCPYGALTGLLGMIGPTSIRRNEQNCINCGKCSESCPHNIDVKKQQKIFSPECSGCMDCVNSCPVGNTLSFNTGFIITNQSRKWTTKTLGNVISLTFFSLVYIATISGHWKSELPENELKQHLKSIDSPQLTHPGVQFRHMK